MSSSKTISKEFFIQQQDRRGGSELYNGETCKFKVSFLLTFELTHFSAAGDKVNTLNSFMEKTEKKRLDREAAKDKVQYAIRTVEALMKEKLVRHQKQRVERSAMTNASKYAKVGDEFNMRKEIESGYPVDQRDPVVRSLFLHLFLNLLIG